MAKEEIPTYFIFKVRKLGDENRQFLSHTDWVKFAYQSKGGVPIEKIYFHYLCSLPTKIMSYYNSVEDLGKNLSVFMVEDALNHRDARFIFSIPSNGSLHYENTEMDIELYENLNNLEQDKFLKILSKESDRLKKERLKSSQ